jgi:hypothetical protein
MIISQRPSVAAGAPKSGGPAPKKTSPEEVALDIRAQADADMARANDLKAQSQALKDAGTAQATQGATNVAEGGVKVTTGHANIFEGQQKQSDGQTTVDNALQAEQAALDAEKSGIETMKQQISEAKDLNSASQQLSALAGVAMVVEGAYIVDAAMHNATFNSQLAEGQAHADQLGAKLADLRTGLDKEAAANAKVKEEHAAFDAGLAQNRAGTEMFIAGVGQQIGSSVKLAEATEQEEQGLQLQGHSDIHNAQGNSKKEQSFQLGVLSAQAFREADSLSTQSKAEEAEATDEFGVSCLLARIAQVDAEAGASLQQINGFIEEGTTNLEASELKNTSSENHRQDGLRHQQRADQLAADAQIAFDDGHKYGKESVDKAGQAFDLFNQAADEKSAADAKFAEAEKLHTESNDLKAQGDANVEQGSADREEGMLTATFAAAGMAAGLAEEQAAHSQMNQTSSEIPAITDAQTANIAQRQETLAKADEAYANIAEQLDIQAQIADVQGQIQDQKVSNLLGRGETLAGIVSAEEQQLDALKQQEAGLDQIQEGTDQERQGGEQIRDGKHQIALGKTEWSQGNAQIKKGDEIGQAGAVLENKANKYNEIADSVDGGNNQGGNQGGGQGGTK